MKKTIRFVAIIIAVFLCVAGVAYATTHDFFQGKVVRIIVGASAGGGFDTYARTVARHMGKHIPGKPNIIVENMPGAGQRIAANYVFKVAKPDGLTIGHFFGGLLVGQVLGHPGIEFDARKFEYVGAPAKDSPVCALTKASGVTSVEKWMFSNVPVKLGSTGADDLQMYGVPRILNATIGLPVQVIAGYKGTADVRLAAENGELAGGCWGWESVRVTWRKAVEEGDVLVVVQIVPQALPDLSNVPLAIKLAKTEEGRQLIQAGVHDVSAILRPYVLPPGTPKERVATLRRAFAETVRDPDFGTDAAKSKLEVSAISGEELERTVMGFFKLKPEVLARLKKILK